MHASCITRAETQPAMIVLMTTPMSLDPTMPKPRPEPSLVRSITSTCSSPAPPPGCTVTTTTTSLTSCQLHSLIDWAWFYVCANSTHQKCIAYLVTCHYCDCFQQLLVYFTPMMTVNSPSTISALLPSSICAMLPCKQLCGVKTWALTAAKLQTLNTGNHRQILLDI